MPTGLRFDVWVPDLVQYAPPPPPPVIQWPPTPQFAGNGTLSVTVAVQYPPPGPFHVPFSGEGTLRVMANPYLQVQVPAVLIGQGQLSATVTS